MALKAVQFVKALATGSTKPFIVEGEDGELYVVKGGVKFVDTTVQVCEWLAYRLGCLLQLPIAPGIIIEIPEQLIDRVPEMQANRIVGGLYYGSRYLYPTLKISLNEKFISQCKNRAEGAAMILFDHWICNFDRTSNFENLIITKNGDLHFHMIDHNGAFYGGWWFDEVYPISPQTFWGKIYQSFVPYIDKTDPFAEIIQHRFLSVSGADIREAVMATPLEWGVPETKLHDLAEFLDATRHTLHHLMIRHRWHFPIWSKSG